MPPSNARRKVALIRTNFLPYSETFIHDELRHHQRYDATVMARQHRNADRFTGHRVVAVESVPAPRQRLASALFGLTGYSRLWHRTFQTESFDIVHVHFGHNALYALPYVEKYDLPLVISLHGRDVSTLHSRDRYYRPEYTLYWQRRLRLFARTHLFLAASDELRDLIVAAGCPHDQVVVHRLGLDIKRFQPPASPRQNVTPQVLMGGRFVEKIGHIYGFIAASGARAAGCVFARMVVGDGALMPRYRAEVSRLGISDAVTFTGPLPHEAVREQLLSSDIMLAPSVVARNGDRDSGLIVAKEAAACAVPVIGTFHGGIPDIIEDEKTGCLVPERDVDALADRRKRLLKDASLRRQMGTAARQHMEKNYNIVERVNALEDIYDHAIAEHRRARRIPTS